MRSRQTLYNAIGDPRDDLHVLLGGLGTIPVFGEVFDVMDGGIYAMQGDNVNAAASFSATIPVIGLGTKYTIKGVGKIAAKTRGTATLYRNFGWNELSSIKNAGGSFSIHPNQFQGKQFWVGESGMNMWTNSSFAKPFTAKITVPKSFVTPGHKNYIFMESDMMIDGFPGGTVLPSNLKKFNSAMKIDWIRY